MPPQKAICFNTQPPEGGCEFAFHKDSREIWFQHTATRRWLRLYPANGGLLYVSTHSHPKVAAFVGGVHSAAYAEFQHTATRRWLLANKVVGSTLTMVSTHSHPKVAAQGIRSPYAQPDSFNTQPPEGGCLAHQAVIMWMACFNTQPPEGGCPYRPTTDRFCSSFNTQPPEGGCSPACGIEYQREQFQHTATRRWLPAPAARQPALCCFNTQPPEGGCLDSR